MINNNSLIDSVDFNNSSFIQCPLRCGVSFELNNKLNNNSNDNLKYYEYHLSNECLKAVLYNIYEYNICTLNNQFLLVHNKRLKDHCKDCKKKIEKENKVIYIYIFFFI